VSIASLLMATAAVGVTRTLDLLMHAPISHFLNVSLISNARKKKREGTKKLSQKNNKKCQLPDTSYLAQEARSRSGAGVFCAQNNPVNIKRARVTGG
jgi:hypothetical protein